jgi:hypothetical protein
VTGRDGPELPGDYYLKSISLDNRDLINKTIALSTTNVPDIQIVIGIAQQISGNVQPQNGQSTANISMTFTSRGAADSSRFTRTAVTNQGGDFSIRGLAPGEYIVSSDAGDSGLSISVSGQQNPPLLLILKPDHTLGLRSP